MGAKGNFEAEQPAEPRVDGGRPKAGWFDVKTEVARKLIEAMEKGETPWQKPWSSQALQPRNPVTGHGYRGINRLLLSLAGGNGLWVTFQQARAQGWRVREGEKGTMIVKVVDLDPRPKREGERESAPGGDGAETVKSEKQSAPRNVALRHYYVFGAHQIDGMPALEPPGELDFHPVEKAESILSAMQELTDLKIIYGHREACYVPSLDEVRLPAKKSFKSVYDLYSVAMHECSHATLHAKRLNRTDALGKRWGDQAYSLEELRAEISSAILASTLGIEATDEQRNKHFLNHVGYLQSWIKAIRKDPIAIFSAAKDAEQMAEYIIGIERKKSALAEHGEWLAEYDATPTR